MTQQVEINSITSLIYSLNFKQQLILYKANIFISSLMRHFEFELSIDVAVTIIIPIPIPLHSNLFYGTLLLQKRDTTLNVCLCV